ncbi:MAG: Dihydrofolate reductase [Candidatus Woesebacteria bacterium GW2011_GWB1_39_10b]|uniref:Dihydrofolate reductase n=2 Tax=Candidatus Woeseibacteriota TaxID=1752722 RepID=A0A0G0N343_9BACT|nr:MAG: Dihydrofolate reductase [Microgenomates group bacterium GW2011_GWC1_38_12]KKQ93463.1 MAG: Dihydrofolate reductase [Candidatus Woesebacteria bacterium GW2011_GWB1_39_10b]KKR10634.1 MAG: Dihydrofolate reductase [Candidatus Woesebacteria bacterium GW2011_GWA1_39_21b]
MKVSIVVAVSENNVIGANNKLPWYLPADLKRFKELTLGHHTIMGRKTHESIGKVLPGRTNILVTRNPDYIKEGVVVVNSLDNAYRLAEKSGEKEAFVIGGAEIFKEALPKADRIYMTKVIVKIDGDVFFPSFDEKQWKVISRNRYKADEKNPYRYEFLTLLRINRE